MVVEPACQCRTCAFDLWIRKIPWKRKWQPTAIFLPGECHGQRSGRLQSMGSQRVSTTECLLRTSKRQAPGQALTCNVTSSQRPGREDMNAHILQIWRKKVTGIDQFSFLTSPGVSFIPVKHPTRPVSSWPLVGFTLEVNVCALVQPSSPGGLTASTSMWQRRPWSMMSLRWGLPFCSPLKRPPQPSFPALCLPRPAKMSDETEADSPAPCLFS